MEAIELAEERIAHAFADPFVVNGEPCALGASVGRAVWPDDADEIEALMRRADAEMYRSKRSARAV
jgi:GGDEF domain-containing protein